LVFPAGTFDVGCSLSEHRSQTLDRVPVRNYR
jgi:hypothetical protein